MPKRMSAIQMAVHQQRQLVSKACATYCTRTGRKDIPDLVVHVMDRFAANCKIVDLEWAITKISEMVEKFDVAEKDPSVLTKIVEKAKRLVESGKAPAEVEFRKKKR